MTSICLSNLNMALSRIVAGILFVPSLLLLPVFLLMIGGTELEAKGYLLLIMAPLGAWAFGWMALTAVLSITFAEAMTVRTVFGRKSHDLEEIAGIGFAVLTTRLKLGIPIARHLLMTVALASGKTFQVKLSEEQADRVARYFRERGLEDRLQP